MSITLVFNFLRRNCRDAKLTRIIPIIDSRQHPPSNRDDKTIPQGIVALTSGNPLVYQLTTVFVEDLVSKITPNCVMLLSLPTITWDITPSGSWNPKLTPT